MADEGKMLATIARSATEQTQIAIKSYRGKSYLDLRIFYTTDDGQTWLPTKKGVTFGADALMTLKDAVEKAMEELLTNEDADA